MGPTTTPGILSLNGKRAARRRWHPDQPDDDLRAELAEERLAEFIRRELENAPPLSRAQRDRLALLLNFGAGADGT